MALSMRGGLQLYAYGLGLRLHYTVPRECGIRCQHGKGSGAGLGTWTLETDALMQLAGSDRELVRTRVFQRDSRRGGNKLIGFLMEPHAGLQLDQLQLQSRKSVRVC